MKGAGDITNAPYINAKTLREKGFNDADLTALNKALGSAFEIQFAFNVWTLSEDCMRRAEFDPSEYNDPKFHMLKAMGFTDEEIEAANDYVCGTMTIEGAPYLKVEHYPIFDCANKCGKKGKRFIHYMGHVRMMSSAQPFLSGAISKTINMPNEVTVEDVKQAYEESWRLGLKAVALYRDGCKLSQPLSTSSNKSDSDTSGRVGEKDDEIKNEIKTVETAATVTQELEEAGAPATMSEVSQAILAASKILQQHIPDSHAMESYGKDGTVTDRRIYLHGEKRRLPSKRSGITVSAKVGNQQIWLRTGEYPDGKLAEIFIDMYKEGAAFQSMLNMFAISVSMGLQYGVPLEKYVNNFTFTRFEPSGMTDHPNVKVCTSIIDFVFRVLGMEYLGRTDFVQVPPKGIQKNRFEQMARLFEAGGKQEAMELGVQSASLQVGKLASSGQVAVDDQATLPLLEVKTFVPDAMGAALSEMDGDAPACPTCGHITVRNGACYKCLNCGDSLGCS